MANKKSRLSRKAGIGKKNSRLELSKQFRNLSNTQLNSYSLSKSTDPIAVNLRKLARAEVARRKGILKVWKKGVPVKGQKRFGVKAVAKEAVVGVRKGVGFLGKAISGELAREFQEDIATVGMSPEQKKKWQEKQVEAEKKRVEQEKKEEAEMRGYGFGG